MRGMGILRTAVREHERFVRVRLPRRLRAGGPEAVRGQWPGAAVPGVLRAGQGRGADGLQVPEPDGGGERDGGQWHGLLFRAQCAVLVGREAAEGADGPADGRIPGGRRQDVVRTRRFRGPAGAGRVHVARHVGARVGGRRLGGQQAVRGGRRRPEGGRVRGERPVARGRAQQQPDQPVGHSARPDARLHVRGRWQPAGPGRHGRRRRPAHRH